MLRNMPGVFTSQGFGEGNRTIMCASCGMNVDANTMSLSVRDLGMTIIPEGQCTVPTRVIENYRPLRNCSECFQTAEPCKKAKAGRN